METTLSHTVTTGPTKTSLWAGRIVSAICVLFLLLDAFGKIFLESHSVDGSAKLGIPADVLQPTGIVLLICVILYVIPRTAIMGAISLTGFLGGATAVKLLAQQNLYFSLVFIVLVWIGLALREVKVQNFLLRNQ